jgi:hypothetical protein
MYVYIHMCVYVCLTHAHVYTHACMCTRARAHTHTQTHKHTYVCMYIYSCVHSKLNCNQERQKNKGLFELCETHTYTHTHIHTDLCMHVSHMFAVQERRHVRSWENKHTHVHTNHIRVSHTCSSRRQLRTKTFLNSAGILCVWVCIYMCVCRCVCVCTCVLQNSEDFIICGCHLGLQMCSVHVHRYVYACICACIHSLGLA